MGANFIQRGNASKFVIPSKPKNSSRGGDTFCPPRGGVEGRTNLFFEGENYNLERFFKNAIFPPFLDRIFI